MRLRSLFRRAKLCYSDPFDFNLPALTNLAVTIYLATSRPRPSTAIRDREPLRYIQSGNVVTATSMPAAATTQHWYIITGVDVLADGSSKTVVTLGDSITDGRGSTTDGNDRWPDDLAQRLSTTPPRPPWRWTTWASAATGFSAGWDRRRMNRFDRDVLHQSGVRWLIVLKASTTSAAAPAPPVSSAPTAIYRQGSCAQYPRVWRHHHAVRRERLLHRGARSHAADGQRLDSHEHIFTTR